MLKVKLGLAIAFTGISISLAPTLLFMAYAEQGLGKAMALEVASGVPVYLASAIAGIPISLAGLIIFRRGLRAGLEDLAKPVGPPRLNMSSKPLTEGGSDEAIEELLRYAERETSSKDHWPPNKGGIIVRNAGTEMVCKSCGSSAPLRSMYCPDCGSSFGVSEGEGACPVCGVRLDNLRKLSEDLYICGSCFSELEIIRDTQHTFTT